MAEMSNATVQVHVLPAALRPDKHYWVPFSGGREHLAAHPDGRVLATAGLATISPQQVEEALEVVGAINRA